MSWDEGRELPKARQELFIQIVRLTDSFCAEYLDDEYAEICEFMAADLCELERSPLDKGRVPSWAGGIVFTVGSVNFLNDPGFDPYLGTAELAQLLKVSEGTLYSKRKQIEKALGVIPFDPNYTVSSMMEDNPLVWMVEVNGFPIDIRNASRDMQIDAYEKGLIPYLPSAVDDEEDWDDEQDDLDIVLEQDQNLAKIIKFPGLMEMISPDEPSPTKKKKPKST